MEKEYKMSQARKDELEQELNYLKTTRSDEVAEQIKIARGFGDLSENSEYDEAKNEQGKLYSRIAELEVILQHVVIVDETAPSDVISIGCTVTVRAANGMEASYRIVGSQESDPMHHLRGIPLRQGVPGRPGGAGRGGGSPLRQYPLHRCKD